MYRKNANSWLKHWDFGQTQVADALYDKLLELGYIVK